MELVKGMIFQYCNGRCLQRKSTHPLFQGAALSRASKEVSSCLVPLNSYLFVMGWHDRLRTTTRSARSVRQCYHVTSFLRRALDYTNSGTTEGERLAYESSRIPWLICLIK